MVRAIHCFRHCSTLNHGNQNQGDTDVSFVAFALPTPGEFLLASKSTAGRIVLIESILRAKAGASGNRRHALLVGIVAAIG